MDGGSNDTEAASVDAYGTHWGGFNETERIRIARRFRYHVRTERYNPRGPIVREPCVICGDTEKVEAHHVDYSKPFLVAWLCVGDHRRAEHGTLELKPEHLRDYSGVVRVNATRWLDTPF